MKKRLIFTAIAYFLINANAYADLNIVVSYPYIGDITKKVGGDNVSVTVFGKGDWDMHFVVPRPSFIAKTRNADLLIMNGAQLEIGWLPPLLNQANNPELMPGKSGILDLSNFVKLIDIPGNISRSMGDVHPAGNPHYQLDPGNIPLISAAIAKKLAMLDPEHAGQYQKNNAEFSAKWKVKLAEWDGKMSVLKGSRVIQYHKLCNYFLKRYNLMEAGTIEPLPGIPPSSRHLENLIAMVKREGNVKFILQDVYHPDEASRFLRDKTGVNFIVFPHDVNAVNEASDIFSLFESIVRRLTQ